MHACVRCICNCLYTLRRDVLNILNKITLIHTVFHHMFCFVAHLCTSASNEQLTFVQPKSNEASFFFSFFLQSTYQPPPPFSSGPLHFHRYPNHCVSHGLLQSMDRRKIFFHVEYSECCFFFFSFSALFKT